MPAEREVRLERDPLHAGEAEELTRVQALQRPQPVPVPVEPGLDPLDRGVAGGPVERTGEMPHHLGVCIEYGEWLPVAVPPSPQQQPVCASLHPAIVLTVT